jgi:hypothetical protein
MYGNENKARYRFRLMYDLMYKVGIKIVILQIIFGIIIDTFAGKVLFLVGVTVCRFKKLEKHCYN